MMRGYWRDPELTARGRSTRAAGCTPATSAFVDDDANLRIVGRLKEMYIRGGYNVYPVEVEGVLAEHPAVGRVAVVGVARPGPRRDRRRVRRPARRASTLPALEPDELRAWCRGRLADYKAPDRVVVVDDLPVNSMHKVDKQALTARAAAEDADA